uniref:Uncharacterized protein n=1 Tax=Amphimedon queenslandica TaxID=400682 RepID=A0A1X7VEQ1_AMPQE
MPALQSTLFPTISNDNINDAFETIKWRHQHEDDARQQYITVLQQHCNLQTSSSGLIIEPAIPLMGASLDGFRTFDCCGKNNTDKMSILYEECVTTCG